MVGIGDGDAVVDLGVAALPVIPGADYGDGVVAGEDGPGGIGVAGEYCPGGVRIPGKVRVGEIRIAEMERAGEIYIADSV